MARKRGWTTAKQVRNVNMPLVTRDCMNVLKSMSSWSWDEYKAALTKKGYTIHERKDDDGILHGYAIMKGKTKYKASDLGIGRNLMVSKLFARASGNFLPLGRNFIIGQALQRTTNLKTLIRNRFRSHRHPLTIPNIRSTIRIRFPIH